MKYYVVCEGIAKEGYPGENEWDGRDSVAVIASCPQDALDLAARYDDNLIGYDNHIFDGKVVVAIKGV